MEGLVDQTEVGDLSAAPCHLPLGGNAQCDDELGFGTKKRRKPKKSIKAQLRDAPNVENEEVCYYYELLKRAFVEITKHCENKDRPKCFTVHPPQLLRQSIRVAFVNFADICKQIQRPCSHVKKYIGIEFGAACSINAKNHLVLRGRFNSRNMQDVLRSYIKEYVLCHACRSCYTQLERDGRVTFLTCYTCKAACSVEPLKEGYKVKTRYS